jgi:predicted alpha/beta hydrolase family esterase
MRKHVLFIQGAGAGAHEEDRLLVASLQHALGSAYDVRYPRMPDEDDAQYGAWKARIATELDGLDGAVALVGHSVGGSVLLKHLSEERVARPILGLFLVAAPFWSGEGIWVWDDVRLPPDLEARLDHVPRIFLYHSRDDEVVPFAHLSRHAALLPRATVRALDGRGHQLGNDLGEVAQDIRSAGGESRR